MQKKIERRINDIASVTGEYPEEIAITRQEFEQLAKELGDNTPLNQFRGCKLKIID
jgi:hypothetical protein